MALLPSLRRFAVKAAKKAEMRAAEEAATRAAERAAERTLAVRPRAVPQNKTLRSSPPKALPAPPKVLALPPPGPGLPSFAAKPRGGQWWVDREISGANFSPEHAARGSLPVGVQFSSDPRDKALKEWWQRAVPKYLKTDFASPTDPLRDLAARDLLHMPDVGPEDWSELAKTSFIEDPIEQILYGEPARPGAMPGAGDDLRGETMVAMPWLAKQPVTDNVYGVSPNSLSGLNFAHVADELRNAMSDVGDIPMDLAVRPEMLERMSFPQAVERVGRINQWRAKQMEAERAAQMNNPAVQMFKEYSDDPSGMRWVELRAPQVTDLPAEFAVRPYSGQMAVFDAEDNIVGMGASEAEARADALRFAARDLQIDPLRQALKAEGDTMGHCVGGYCDDVLSGRSRIFSLRDAKGMPHVTVETRPTDRHGAAVEHLRALDVLPDWQEYIKTTPGLAGMDKHDVLAQYLSDRGLPSVDYSGQNIIQIKGKQNRAPNPEYLPYVQDFVKSGQWGDVGDLANTGLVRLPDKRFIRNEDFDNIVRNEGLDDLYQSYDFSARGFPRDPSRMSPEDWEQFSRHFEGYRRGGLAVKKCDCMQCGGLAVRRAA